MTAELWTPSGAVPLGAASVGRNKETGSPIVAHTVLLKAKDRFGREHKMRVQILADDSTSQSEVEDMMGNAAEKFLQEVREKYDKRPATAEEIKHAGKALDDFLKYRVRRRDSTTRKIYF